MKTFVVGLFVTVVAATSAWAGEQTAADANAPATNVAVGTLAATASREVGQVVSVVTIVDPREPSSEARDAANAERCRPASERDSSLIPLAP